MRTNDRQRQVRLRVVSTYVQQRMLTLLSGVPVSSIVLTSFVVASQHVPVVLATLIFTPLIMFAFGVWGLVEGTADPSVRRRVRAGTFGSLVLIGLSPVAAKTAPSAGFELGVPLMQAWIGLGAITCVVYLFWTRRYLRYVRSCT